MICQYLRKRAVKDKFEREKQLTKAKQAILSPSKIVGRFRFLKSNGEKYLINEELITKAEKLEGVKGYLTNTSINKKMLLVDITIYGELKMISVSLNQIWKPDRSFFIWMRQLPVI